MSNKIACPSCGDEIEGEKFQYPVKDEIRWYQFVKMKPHCPHCGVSLRYKAETQVLVYSIGVVFFLSILLVSYKIAPFYILPIMGLVFGTIFWQTRVLAVDEKNS